MFYASPNMTLPWTDALQQAGWSTAFCEDEADLMLPSNGQGLASRVEAWRPSIADTTKPPCHGQELNTDPEDQFATDFLSDS